MSPSHTNGHSAANNYSVSDAVKLLVENMTDLKTLERCAIEAALKKCSGNISRTIKLLGIGRTTLYRKIHRYGIDHQSIRP